MSVRAVVPDFFTLPEAGRILRIGRNSAYKLAIEFEETGGQSGLPFVKLGRLKRVPRSALEKLHGGPITWPLADDGTPCATAKRSDESDGESDGSEGPVETAVDQPRRTCEVAPATTIANGTATPATKHAAGATAREARSTAASSPNPRRSGTANTWPMDAAQSPLLDLQLGLGF